MPVTVRLFAAAREAAGVPAVEVPAGRVAEVCDAVAAAVPAQRRSRLSALLDVCTLLGEDGARYRRADAAVLPEGGTIDVLPPFAGG